MKIICLLSLPFILFLLPNFTLSQTQITVQGDVVNLRKLDDVKSEVVVQGKRFDELSLIEKGKEATINGIIDNWYKVKTKAGKIGYIFGHFTSLKKKGQITSIMTLNNVILGDCFHLIFDEIDFGDGRNQLGKYEGIIEDAYTDEKVYVGSKFRVTYNTLYSMKSMACSPNYPEELIETSTIIKLEKVD